jgi:hypothetical protein
MKWSEYGVVGLLCVGLFAVAGCGDSVASAQEAGAMAPAVVDYHVVYGLTEEVSTEVRTLIASGWQPIGPLQPTPCVNDPSAYCGQQTLVRTSL